MSTMIFKFCEIYIYKIEIFDYNRNILKGGERMNSYIIEKLKEGRANAKLKQSEVAEKIGIKGNTLSNYENGVSEPDIDTFCALCDIYNIDPSNILNEAYGLGVQGKDFKIKPSEIKHIEKYRDLDHHGKKMVDFTLNEEWARSTAAPPEHEPTNEIHRSNTRLINYYYRLASAGTGQIVFDAPPTRHIEIPDIPKYRKADYAIGVNGKSMEPTFHDGDMILIEMTEEIEPGEIGIFLVNNESYVKKLGDGELISLNPDYNNIPLNESSICLGRVIDKL